MSGWHLSIGDPIFIDGFTVAAYAATALLCFRSYRLAGPPVPLTRLGILNSRVRRRFWLLATAVLAAFGAGKQVDLQAFLLDVGRMLAKSDGWYESRRTVQYVFMAGIAASGAAAVMAALWAFRRGGAWVQLAQFGLAALCAFVIVRAASFHDVDVLLGTGVGVFRLNNILELSGIAIIAVAAGGAAAGRMAGAAARD